MKMIRIYLVVAVTIFAVANSGAANAQQSSATQDLINGILDDVIARTVEVARKEVKRNTGIDPLKRGYNRAKSYDPVSGEVSDETKRELQKLNEEHDRKIAKLEEELDRKLTKAEDEFQRETAKEDKEDKIKEKGEKLKKKTDEAYAKFEEKIEDENKCFDEKRSKILEKR